MKMRILDAMPAHHRKRYKTRMMTADDGSINMSPRDAQFFRRMGWAEEAGDEPNSEPVAAPEPTREDLMAQAMERGIEMPPGYVSKAKLRELLVAADEPDDGEAADEAEEDGAA